jgi:uncharacterized membrane protein YfcA
MMPEPWLLAVLAAGAAVAGTLGGLGGAIFLVPALILAGVDPLLAVPLGAASVVAGSLAAGPRQLRTGLVHHRIGVTIEVVAATGAVVGAIIGDRVPTGVLTWVLAIVAVVAAAAAARPTGLYNLPDAAHTAELPGEWPGTLGGSYRLGDEVVPYHARRVPAGLAAMSVAGVISGLAGVGGGFIKVPVMREVMRVPVKVAAATSTFTVGFTAAVSLVVYARQGRIDTSGVAAVVVGALAGGVVGSRVAGALNPAMIRRVIAVLLVAVAVVLVVRQ